MIAHETRAAAMFLCHPERRKHPGGMFSKSNPTKGGHAERGIYEGKCIHPPEILPLAALRVSATLRFAQDDTGGGDVSAVL